MKCVQVCMYTIYLYLCSVCIYIFSMVKFAKLTNEYLTGVVFDYLTGIVFKHIKERQIDEESVEGKIVIVTGANSGLGTATTAELVDRGAIVIMACRNLELGKQAIAEIRNKTDNGKLILMKLDLGDLDSIRKFANEFKSQFSELNILINNAGVFDQNALYQKTKNGFESHIGTNHLGHFLLTNLLLDSLKQGAPSRVISIASSLFIISNFDLDDLMLETTPSFGVLNTIPYANSKLANMLFTKALAKRLEGKGITTYALCPALISTNMFATQPSVTKFLTNMCLKFVGFTPQQGCHTVLACALSKKLASESGQMYRFGKRWKGVMDRPDLDDHFANELWTKSEKLFKFLTVICLHDCTNYLNIT